MQDEFGARKNGAREFGVKTENRNPSRERLNPDPVKRTGQGVRGKSEKQNHKPLTFRVYQELLTMKEMQEEFGATEFPVNNIPEKLRDKRGKRGKAEKQNQ